jgi:LCP family protein required for cell wall assembly
LSRYQGKHTPAETPRKPKKPSRLTRQQKILVAICIVLAVALVLVLVYKALVVRPTLPGEKRPGQDGSTSQEEIDYGDGVQPRVDGERKSEDYYTVLILGRDTGGGGNTDTMLLASYDVTNQKATVMSIPRDTMVNVSWDVKKINSVYNAYGEGDKGIQGLYKEISQLVGFAPDYQVVLEWEAVGAIVEAIGGVWFDVPYDMDYHDPYQDLVIEQAKGYRLLSGDDAMQVIRWRGNDNDSPYGYKKKNGGIGDSGRMKVQQDFLKAVIKQMLTIQNVANLNKIAKVFQENVETDLSFQNILWFAQKAFMGGLSVDDVEFLTMPYKGASAWSRSYRQDLAYVVPIASELLDIVNEKLSPFVEKFTLSDLDIMSVNSDGSLSSTTGYVEDAKAAVAPAKTTTAATAPAASEPTPDEPDTGSTDTGETGTDTEDPITAEEGGQTSGENGGGTDLPTGGETEPSGDTGGDANGPDLPAEPEEPAA